ncbi:hypothetical protein ACFE04_017673 [Oxalis oulophora]
MDDSCAVCADTLEWVAYGPCGHREVCSTCVARLRFICDDRKCCICKTESDKVFVTKALGDYTRMINDFTVFPNEVREGKVGSYWYHEDTQTFFDDMDQYRMVKAMCRLSCSVCDNMDENSNDGPRHRGRFRNIEQLKGHLFHRHRLLMCSLCLEGRKVFICEQKLYTRAQLNQHINTGDSEVDGTESERGGFMGHPLCEFCKSPFYGDNELYLHMSTEHYTCHICQRQHPGQYEYFRNYDDLENHFRGEHFLCEDEACLAKKFTVFQSEAELKRHNAMEHAGRMSRSQRNAALQIPTSFRYRRSNEQDNRRRRGRIAFQDPPDNQLSQAIEASLETHSNDNNTLRDSSPPLSASRVEPVIIDHSDIDPIIPAFESLTSSDSEAVSRYRQALGGNVGALQGSSFPPLPMAPSQSISNNTPESSSSTMASHIRRKNKKNLKTLNSNNRNINNLDSNSAWPAASRTVQPASKSSSSQPRLSSNVVASVSSPVLPSYGRSSMIQARPTMAPGTSAASTRSVDPPASDFPPMSVAQPRKFPMTSSQAALASYASTAQFQARPTTIPGSRPVDPPAPDFPPISVAQVRKLPLTSQAASSKVEDVQTANKSLIEKIRIAVGDEDIFSAFKNITGQYRQGSIDTKTYLEYVQGYGLSHLVVDLARLCPDPQKQKELIDAYNNLVQENGQANESVWWKDSKGSKKGKGKAANSNAKSAAGGSTSNNLTDSILASVRELQPSYSKVAEEEVEVLTKDGYRKGKSTAPIEENRGVQNDPPLAGAGSNGKQKKKTSKFLRVRLGDGSMAALLDSRHSDSDPDPDVDPLASNSNGDGLAVRGVWRKGGGSKLFP